MSKNKELKIDLSKKEIPISFSVKSGNNLIGIIHKPDVEASSAVILAHGFQRNKMGNAKNRSFVKLARELRDQGFLVFRFDFEGCGDSEGDLRDLTIDQEVTNLESAWNLLKSQFELREESLFLLGESLGSVVVSLFAEKFNPKGLVFWTQGFNQGRLLKKWNSEQDIKEVMERGWKKAGSKILGKKYLEENLNKDYTDCAPDDVPILILHGDKDEDVPAEDSNFLAQQKENIEFELIRGGNHKFEGCVDVLISKTAKWIEENN